MKNLITCLVVCVLSGTALATTWTVDDDGKADFDNIQDAIDAASDGDEIIVMPGTYTSTQGGHVVNMKGKAVTLRSSDPSDPDVVAATIIDGEDARRGLACYNNETSKTIISGFTITNGFGIGFDYIGNGGSSTDGGGMHNYKSNPTLTNCIFYNNTATNGGGMYNTYYSSPTLTGCTFENNTATYIGGGMFSGWDGYSSPTLIDSLFCGNTPDQIFGDRTDGGGSCIAFSCDDSDGDGWPDKCGSIGDGVHEVPSEFSTIQAAIDAAGNGDEILIAPGTYTGDHDAGAYQSVIDLGGKRLWIHSSDGPEVTIIDGQNSRGGIACVSGEPSETVIEGLTITNGYRFVGGGLICFGSPTIIDCAFTNNTAYSTVGGGMYNSGSPTLIDCTFENNTASGCCGGGGMYNELGSPTLENCTFTSNTAASRGGGMYNYSGSPTLIDCTFTSNTTDDYGGGMFNSYYSSPTLTNTTVCGNTPDQILGFWTDGGGSCIANSCEDNNGDGIPDKCTNPGGGNTILVPEEYATIQDAINVAVHGDEIIIGPGTYTGVGNWVINPMGKRLWIHSSDGPEVTIIDGEGVRRGIECIGGETIFEGLTITNGYADSGGGMYNYYSSPTLTNCIFENNTAEYGGGVRSHGGGGGMHNYNSNPTLDGCTFTNNTATNSSSGGGMFNNYSSSPTLTNCTFKGNTADVYGGGMCNSSNSSATLTDTTVCGNTPDQIVGDWTDGGGSCIAYSCEDNNGDGIPDKCTNPGGNTLLVPEEYARIQDAINVAVHGDEIIIGPGTYTGVGDWVVNPMGKRLWIHSSDGPEVTIIDGEGARRGIECIGGETIFEGLTITNGYANSGGGMYNYYSSPTLTNCIFENNTAEYGGGMYNSSYSSTTLTNCAFKNNTAYMGGGMYNSWSGSPTLIECTFENNTADFGGGMSNWNCSFSCTTLTDTTVCGNTPDQIRGRWTDNGGNTIADECPIDCPDINGDGYVNVSDLLAVIDQWGLTDSPADVNFDGIVNVSDLLMVVGNWGPCE